MVKVVFGNHSSVLVPRQDRDNIRTFYCDVLDGLLMRADSELNPIRLGDGFYIAFSTAMPLMRASSCEVPGLYGSSSKRMTLKG
jgi:hypothetical protein